MAKVQSTQSRSIGSNHNTVVTVIIYVGYCCTEGFHDVRQEVKLNSVVNLQSWLWREDKQSWVCRTRCIQYWVDAVLGVFSTRCMLYSVFACICCTLLLGVNSLSSHGERESDDYTLGSAVIVEVVNEKEREGGWRSEPCGGDKQIWAIWGYTCMVGLGRPRIGVVTCQNGNRTCSIGERKLTLRWNFLSSHCLLMICHIISHLASSCPRHYHHLHRGC